MRPLNEQLPIKSRWRDAHVVSWDLAKTICQNIIYKKPVAFKGLSSKFKVKIFA